MRVIAGKYGGRRLVAFHLPTVRPTTDIVKGSIFNKLSQTGHDQALVLDLFSGTGSLGIEALSRFANKVFFVEKNRACIEVIRKNLDVLKVSYQIGTLQRANLTEHSPKVHIIVCEVLRFLSYYEAQPFDFIFIDPPFTKKMADRVMAALSRSKVLKNDTTQVILESSPHEILHKQYGPLQLLEQKKFGDKVVSYFKCGGLIHDSQ